MKNVKITKSDFDILEKQVNQLREDSRIALKCHVIKPFCEKYNINFLSGMGSYWFMKNKKYYPLEKIPKRIMNLIYRWEEIFQDTFYCENIITH